jgi:hypothetical protein
MTHSERAESTHRASGRGLTRRRILGGAAATVAAATIVPRHVLGGAAEKAPSQKPNLAGVGIGGVGHGQLAGCEKAGFQIVALCDIDDAYGKRSYDKWPQARKYRDFREMLEAEGDKIDAMYCGTPDHTHAIITLPALRKNKHVCCVKPLTRTLEENRVVVECAKKVGVATQVTASPNTSERACRTCELIWAGAIGPVREVHIWSNRPLWPQGMVAPDWTDPVPSTLDWDLWIGPSPMRPFVADWPKGHHALQQVKTGGGRTAVYLPDRVRDGYGLQAAALARCLERYGPGLVVTADCGTNSCEAVAFARAACSASSVPDPQCLLSLAAAQAESGDFPAAVATAEEALAAASGNAALEQQLGDVVLPLLRQGKPLRAGR